MKFATIHAHHLLNSKESSSYIIKELVTMQRYKLITPVIVKYVLKRRNISFSLYESAYYGMTRFNEYRMNETPVPVPN
ncbi:hypothetical protein CN918_25245 [Priestia megaterium]|nr:hypothetical protein CN918_25245 [Priestia megaterium]